MTWYNSGTITVTNGQTLITGVGTDFVANALAGQGIILPDGRTYEIQNIISATQLGLRSIYLGGTGSGQSYSIIPTQSLMKDFADQAASLITSFASVRDGIGAGLMADGTQSAPGIRFAGDQDTGIRRTSENGFSLVTSGTDRFSINNFGVGVGTFAADARAALLVQGADQSVAALTDSGAHGASILLRAIGSTVGDGGAVLFGTTFGNSTAFAAIKAGVSDGASNQVGSLSIALRAATSDTSLTERVRFMADGKIGLGISAPVTQMHIRGVGQSTLSYSDSGAGGGALYLQDSNGAGGAGGMLLFGVTNGDGTPFAAIKGSLVNGADRTIGDIVLSTRDAVTTPYTTARWIWSYPGHYLPASDNAADIGNGSNRIRTLYAGTGSINTSDARLKQEVGLLPDDWLDAWGDVRHVRFKFNDAVAERGENARWHVGFIAQEIRDAFADRDLDATTIGLLCHDSWEETLGPVMEMIERSETISVPHTSGSVLGADGLPMVTYTQQTRTWEEEVDTGETQVVREAGDRWSLRYDECAVIESAWQRREIAKMAARLAVLEAA